MSHFNVQAFAHRPRSFSALTRCQGSSKSPVAATALLLISAIGLAISIYLAGKTGLHGASVKVVAPTLAMSSLGLLGGAIWLRAAVKSQQILRVYSRKPAEARAVARVETREQRDKRLIQQAVSQLEIGDMSKIAEDVGRGHRRVVSMVNQDGFKGFILHDEPKEENTLKQGSFSRKTTGHFYYIQDGQWVTKDVVILKVIKRFKNTERASQDRRLEGERRVPDGNPRLLKALFALHDRSNRSGVERAFVVYEKFDCDLQTYLQREGSSLTTTAKLEIFREICLAVKALHDASLIHRDIKPGNILIRNVNGRLEVALSDFEFVIDRSQGRMSNRFRGTPAYGGFVYINGRYRRTARTEQIVNTPAQDYFALGVTLRNLFPVLGHDSSIQVLAEGLRHGYASLDYAILSVNKTLARTPA